MFILLIVLAIAASVVEVLFAIRGWKFLGFILPVLITLGFLFIDFGYFQIYLLICCIILWLIFLISILMKMRKKRINP